MNRRTPGFPTDPIAGEALPNKLAPLYMAGVAGEGAAPKMKGVEVPKLEGVPPTPVLGAPNVGAAAGSEAPKEVAGAAGRKVEVGGAAVPKAVEADAVETGWEKVRRSEREDARRWADVPSRLCRG